MFALGIAGLELPSMLGLSYPFWDILPLAVGHSGFAGWEQEYLIPVGLGIVVVTAAFEYHCQGDCGFLISGNTPGQVG